MTTPRVSVCIPVYQGERFLPATLESVLAQRGVDLDVVVVDNACTDATPEILQRYAAADPRIRVVRHPDVLDLAANWRSAVEATTAELVKLVCADDLIHPDCCRTQAAVLLDQPDVALVASRWDMVGPDGEVLTRARGLRGLLGRREGRQVARRVVRTGTNPVGISAGVMFRRSDYDRVGGWDGRRVFPMDLDLWLRLLGRGRLLGQADVLTAFRISDTGLSAQHSRTQYEENLDYVREVARDPQWGLGRLDRAVSRLGVPLSWAWWGARSLTFSLRSRLHRPPTTPAVPAGQDRV